MYILYNKKQQQEEYKGACVKLSIPLLMRLLEYAKHTAASDEDLHWITERIAEHGAQDKVLTMEHYTKLIPDSRLVTVEVGPGQKAVAENIGEGATQ
jgi:hypothetical protein